MTMSVIFSNDKPKVNFQLITFQYSEMSELDGSARTRVSKRMDLKIPFNSPEIQAQTNILYYVNLGTSYLPEADFSLAFWYTDEAITHVESAILSIKKRNSSTLVKVLGVIRGRMDEISQKELLSLPEYLALRFVNCPYSHAIFYPLSLICLFANSNAAFLSRILPAACSSFIS